MRTTSQLYTLRFIPVPMKNGTEIKVCQDNGFQPPPSKRKGPCPRGYLQECYGCPHIHFNKLNAPFEILCTDLRLDSTQISLSEFIPENYDDEEDEDDDTNYADKIRHHLHVFYRDMVILDTTVMVSPSLDVSTITSFEELRNNATGIVSMLISHLTELVDTHVIRLEKQ